MFWKIKFLEQQIRQQQQLINKFQKQIELVAKIGEIEAGTTKLYRDILDEKLLKLERQND